MLAVSVIAKYNYRGADQVKNRQAEIRDFRRLNKVVLKEGATNAAVSRVARTLITLFIG